MPSQIDNSSHIGIFSFKKSPFYKKFSQKRQKNELVSDLLFITTKIKNIKNGGNHEQLN